MFGIGELSVSLPRSRALPERRNLPRTLALVLCVCLHSYVESISLCHLQPDFDSRFVYIYLLVYLFPIKGKAVRLVIVCGAIIEVGHLLDLIFQSSSTCVLRVKG